MDTVTFASLEEFLASRGIVRRADGSFMEDSYDYGVHWRDRSGGMFRLTWIGPVGRTDKSAPAGELYLQRLNHPHGVEFLCVIEPYGVYPGSRVRRKSWDDNVEFVLQGWPEACGAEGSVDWVRNRVERALADGAARPATAGGSLQVRSVALPDDVGRARRVAEEIAAEFGLPMTMSREELVDRLAYAYARGSVDGYKDAATQGLATMRQLLLRAQGEDESLDDLSDPSAAEIRL